MRSALAARGGNRFAKRSRQLCLCVRLAQEPIHGDVRVVAAGNVLGKAGGEKDRQIRAVVVDPSREIVPRQATRHDDIAEHGINGEAAFEALDGGGCGGGLDDLVAEAL